MRKALVSLHLWLGLTVGFVWALQGLTGAMLVFHREVERLAGPAVSTEPAASLDLVQARAALAAHATIDSIGIVDRRGDLLAADYRDGGGNSRALLIDAATGRVAAARDREPDLPVDGSAARWLYLLHETALGGDKGKLLIGLSGVLLMTGAATGLLIGWPRRRQWAAAFAARRWRSPPQKLFGWHRAAGLTAGFALLLIALSGTWMIFSADLRPILARLVPYRPPYRATPAKSGFKHAVGPETAFTKAQSAFPAARLVRITMPTDKSPAYTVRLRQSGETRAWSGVTTIVVDAGDGHVLDTYDPLSAPIANHIADAAFSLHNGELAGLPGRIFVMFAGLSLPTLYVTGVLAWLGKRRRKHRLAMRPQVHKPAPA